MGEEIFVDATNTIAGRLASFVAKKALLGYKVNVVNSEKAIITGSKEKILEDFINKLRLGRGVQKGPKISRTPDRILRRIIRGMLPWKRTRGREAFRRIKCFVGVPEAFKDKEILKLETKKIRTKYITIGELSRLVR